MILLFKVNTLWFNYLVTFFNLFGSNILIEDNRAILWLSGWINWDEIVETVGGGGGGGGMPEDDELTATTTKKWTIEINNT